MPTNFSSASPLRARILPRRTFLLERGENRVPKKKTDRMYDTILTTFDYSVINVPNISVERFQSQLKLQFKRRSALTSTHARVHNRTMLKADAVIEIESETSKPTCVCV